MSRGMSLRAAMACALSISGSARAGEESIRLVDGEARDLTATSCVTCHSLDYIQINAPLMNRATWQKSVHKMIEKFGAPIAGEDAARIVDYLSEHYSASDSP
jgi:hypothetical protein